jgi:hypothetical protein
LVPAQIEIAGEVVKLRSGLTVTVTVVEPEHPLASIPVTVYTVVEAGEADTEDPVVALNPVDGDQE